MMGIGFPELMIILVIIMIIFGAGKLPEIGSAFGNSIRNFKKSMKEAEEDTEELPEVADATKEGTEPEAGDAAEAADAAKEVTEGDSDAPETTEKPVTSTSEPEDK